jgi:energy-coupling factor transporter ATP-binding protein EcfA2
MDSAIGEEDWKLKVPAGMIIAGPSASGKSTLLVKLLKSAQEMFHPPPAEVIYAYGQYHKLVPVLQRLEGVSTHPGLPSDEFLAARRRPLLLVMDDLMTSVSDTYLTDLYTKRNHHQGIFSIFVVQNLFDKSIRVARKNSQYVMLTRAPNDMLSVRTLGSHLFPKQLNYFMDAYAQATKHPFGYLLIDMHAASDPQLRLRTDIFPTDNKSIFLPT